MAFRIEPHAEPIPGYRIIERLGGGGFGEVWKAEAPGGLFKAIKFVYGDLQTTNEEGQRAEQELKALNRVKTVRHPYVLSLERYDIVDGQLIIVRQAANVSPPAEESEIGLAAEATRLHVFDAESRQFYALEDLWADAPRLDWERL